MSMGVEKTISRVSNYHHYQLVIVFAFPNECGALPPAVLWLAGGDRGGGWSRALSLLRTTLRWRVRACAPGVSQVVSLHGRRLERHPPDGDCTRPVGRCLETAAQPEDQALEPLPVQGSSPATFLQLGCGQTWRGGSPMDSCLSEPCPLKMNKNGGRGTQVPDIVERGF